jgi:hypothetical protein
MTTQAITIHLSETMYRQLHQAAKLSHQPIELIVEQSLSHSLPPLLKDIPVEYQADVFPLLQMDDSQLQQETRRTFDPDRWLQYEALLEKRKETPLTKSETTLLNTLRREADVLSFRKAYAAVLLKRRGYASPTFAPVPVVQ